MSEQVVAPSMPIPNNDPRCHCALEPGSGAGTDDAVIMSFGDGAGGEARVSVHLDCPHHGRIARSMTEASVKGFSLR